MNESLPLRIREELKKWPFTWEGRKFHREPKGPNGKYAPTVQRAIIRSSLELGGPIFADQIEFLKEYPEHALWLKARLAPELWAKIEPTPGEEK